MTGGAYRPYVPARRPGGKPIDPPVFRVLVHARMLERWTDLVERVGLRSAQQFWDHVAYMADQPPLVNSSCVLRGRAGRPQAPGFSNTIHYEITGSGRIDYQYNRTYVGRDGDAHPVVWVLAIRLGSH